MTMERISAPSNSLFLSLFFLYSTTTIPTTTFLAHHKIAPLSS
jgi:hypothetical protein